MAVPLALWRLTAKIAWETDVPDITPTAPKTGPGLMAKARPDM